MVYNFKSSQTIIAKVFRDLRIQREDWINDAIEWIGESLDAIGTPNQLITKAKIIKTSSHRAAIPSDLYTLDGVYYGLGNNKKDIGDLELDDFPLYMPSGEESIHPSMLSTGSNKKVNAISTSRENYILNGKYIQTSFEEDYIILIYKSFPLDDDNFPMIPDMYEFDQAIYWYIVMKLLEGGEQHPVSGFNFFHAEERWGRFCVRAQGEAKMPDYGEMAKFRDTWVRLVPDWNIDLPGRRENVLTPKDFMS